MFPANYGFSMTHYLIMLFLSRILQSWMYLKKKAGLVGEDIGSHKLDTEHKKKMQEFDKMRVRLVCLTHTCRFPSLTYRLHINSEKLMNCVQLV